MRMKRNVWIEGGPCGSPSFYVRASIVRQVKRVSLSDWLALVDKKPRV